ncbi:MAG: BRO family protein [Cetobacterium sp.]
MDLDFIPKFFVKFFKSHPIEVCLCRCTDAKDIIETYYNVSDIERIFNIKIDIHEYNELEIFTDEANKIAYISKNELEESEQCSKLNEFLMWCDKISSECFEEQIKDIENANNSVHQRMKSLRVADSDGIPFVLDEDSDNENNETISEEVIKKITDDKISAKDLMQCKTVSDVAKKINENKILVCDTKNLKSTPLKMDTDLEFMFVSIYDGQTIVIYKIPNYCKGYLDHNDFYFKVEDVAKALNIKDNIFNLISEFEKQSEFIVITINGKYQTKEIIFLKYRGLMRLMYEKQIPNMHEFIAWIDDVIKKYDYNDQIM